MKLQMSTKNLDKTRYISLVAGFVIMMTLSIAYLWSLYVNPLIELGASENWLSIVYNISVVIAIIFALIGGKMLDRFGSTLVILTGLLSFLVGNIMAGFCTSNVMWFNIGFQIMGWGSAVIYIGVFNNMNRLFPDKKGTAMAIASFGIALGGTFIGPIAQWLIDSFGLSMQFHIVGVGLAIVGCIALFFFPNPPEGYVPEGYVASCHEEIETINDDANSRFIQKDWKAMLKDPVFYMIFMYPIIGVQTGMVITSNVTWMAEEMIEITAAKAAWILSATMMASSIGKIVSGVLGDIIGRLNLSIMVYGLHAVASVGFLIVCMSPSMLSMGTITFFSIFTGVTFGASGALMPALTSDVFGSKNFGFNFAIISQAASIGSMITPWLAFAAKGSMSGYVKLFAVLTVMATISTICAIYIRKTRNDKIEISKKAK